MEDGDVVRWWNDRGELFGRTEKAKSIRKGVAWWR